MHVYYKNRYEEALKAVILYNNYQSIFLYNLKIDILEYELDEMKKLHENLKKDNEKKKKKNFDSDSPLIEKNFKSYNMINQIKLECEKNYLNEDEVSVITKKEEQEMKDKIKEFKQSIIHVEREKDDMLKQMEKLENNIHENNLKIEKITKENNILLLKNEDILLENKKILEEKKSLKIELELLRKKNAFFEKQV